MMAIGRFSRLAPRAPRQSRYVTVFTNRGTKPNDLFEYLLDNVDYSARIRTRLKLAA
ncbi:hypothetical protein DESC_90005 [Desulfosarcina cetonica]|nr:hypothetical protein DESC_90005 [Desulfosarcina cetonica]